MGHVLNNNNFHISKKYIQDLTPPEQNVYLARTLEEAWKTPPF